MSQANASAIKRRAFNGQNPPSTNASLPNSNQNIQTPGLTLPQVISFIDKRLVNLETFVNDSKTRVIAESIEPKSVNNSESSLFTNEVLDEFNHRFEVLADEIGNIKDVIIKLQSYTMEVNKTLFEERINIFSELGETSRPHGLSIMEDTSLVTQHQLETNLDVNSLSIELQSFVKNQGVKVDDDMSSQSNFLTV